LTYLTDHTVLINRHIDEGPDGMGMEEVAGGWGKRIPEPKLKHYQNKKKVKKQRTDSPGPVQSFPLGSRQ
jgi:hypothetical protein